MWYLQRMESATQMKRGGDASLCRPLRGLEIAGQGASLYRSAPARKVFNPSFRLTEKSRKGANGDQMLSPDGHTPANGHSTIRLCKVGQAHSEGSVAPGCAADGDPSGPGEARPTRRLSAPGAALSNSWLSR